MLGNSVSLDILYSATLKTEVGVVIKTKEATSNGNVSYGTFFFWHACKIHSHGYD